MLLAQAHALAGQGKSAYGYAIEMHDYFVTRAETPDWELAFAHAIHAHAAFAAGQWQDMRPPMPWLSRRSQRSQTTKTATSSFACFVIFLGHERLENGRFPGNRNRTPDAQGTE
jgi:hypothetical protein